MREVQRLAKLAVAPADVDHGAGPLEADRRPIVCAQDGRHLRAADEAHKLAIAPVALQLLRGAISVGELEGGRAWLG